MDLYDKIDKEQIIAVLEDKGLDELSAQGATRRYSLYREAVDILWDAWFGNPDSTDNPDGG